MKKLIFIFFLSCFLKSNAQIYSVKEGKITFFSKAPIENIEGTNTSVNSFLNTTTREVIFIVPITSFQFKDKLMQEHFNENYMESNKYPTATFNGKINEAVDLSKDGTYPVTVTGKLKIHGVEKEITEKGTALVAAGQIKVESEFVLMIRDFKIEVPKLVFQNIAENITVKANLTYVPYKKN